MAAHEPDIIERIATPVAVVAFLVLTLSIFGLVFELSRLPGWPRVGAIVVGLSYVVMWFYVQAYGIDPFGRG